MDLKEFGESFGTDFSEIETSSETLVCSHLIYTSLVSWSFAPLSSVWYITGRIPQKAKHCISTSTSDDRLESHFMLVPFILIPNKNDF